MSFGVPIQEKLFCSQKSKLSPVKEKLHSFLWAFIPVQVLAFFDMSMAPYWKKTVLWSPMILQLVLLLTVLLIKDCHCTSPHIASKSFRDSLVDEVELLKTGTGKKLFAKYVPIYKYQEPVNWNITELLKNKTFITRQIKCVLYAGNCDSVGKQIRGKIFLLLVAHLVWKKVRLLLPFIHVHVQKIKMAVIWKANFVQMMKCQKKIIKITILWVISFAGFTFIGHSHAWFGLHFFLAFKASL